MTYYALIDPNWGDPIIAAHTISETFEGAWLAAIADPGYSLYSGYSQYPLPDGTLGDIKKMKSYGFSVKAVNIQSV